MKKMSVITCHLIIVSALLLSSCSKATKISASPTPTLTLTPSVQLSPTATTSPDELLSEAAAFSLTGDDEKAIDAYSQIIIQFPEYAQAYINRGAVYADNGEPGKALSDFNRGLELDPENAMGFSNRSVLNFSEGELFLSMKDVQSVLGLTHEGFAFKNALLVAGQILRSQGENDLAIMTFTKILEVDENFDAALVQRGQIYFNNGDYLRAFSDLSKAINISQSPQIQQLAVDILMKVYPEGSTPQEAADAAKDYYEQAMSLKDGQDYQGSVDALTQAIDIDPLNPEYYYLRGLDYADLGEIDKAISDMSFKIALDPFDSRGYAFRGIIESVASRIPEVITDLEKSLALNPSTELKDLVMTRLETTRNQVETCQFNNFEILDGDSKPLFTISFNGIPNAPYVITMIAEGADSGRAYYGSVPANGITNHPVTFPLLIGDRLPVEIDIQIGFPGCRLGKKVLFPEFDILSMLENGFSILSNPLLFIEDFSGAFDPSWTWIRAGLNQWSLDEIPDSMVVKLTEGNPDAHTLFLKYIETENFEITTKVKFKPDNHMQMVGLVAYENRDNYILFSHAFCTFSDCIGKGLYLEDRYLGEIQEGNIPYSFPDLSDVYLRLCKEGNIYTAYYSTDGILWEKIDYLESKIKPISYGLLIGETHIPIKAIFDYIAIYDNPAR